MIGVPAYENSLAGHAQMLGAERIYDSGDESAAAVNAMAQELREDGGVFQLNHPTNDDPGPFEGCGPELDWTYGLDVRPDVVEVWNAAAASLPESIAYWERCWLDRGERIGATAGSDSHWAALAAAQGAGNPTTWVLGDAATKGEILDAIAAGRTTISRLSPGQDGGRLLLEGDRDGDGTFESTIGDEVRVGSALRVRAQGGRLSGGLVTVRANGETIVADEPLAPDGVLEVPEVAEPGWVRAELRWTPAQMQEALRCSVVPILGELPCPVDQAMAGLTSPIWLAAQVPPGGGGDGGGGGNGGALDREPPRIRAAERVRAAKADRSIEVARLLCGSANCSVRAPARARLGFGAKRLRARVKAPAAIPSGGLEPLRLELSRRAARRIRQQGGVAKLRVAIRSASGNAAERLRVPIDIG